MTTNNPEVKRYNITTDNHYHPVSYETEQGYWVKYSSYEALQAEFVIRLDELSARNYELRMGLAEKTSECEKLRKDAEFGRSVLSKREQGKVYGCHCDLEEGMEPDGCVIDTGERHNCIYAKDIAVKEQCNHWRVIATDTAMQRSMS